MIDLGISCTVEELRDLKAILIQAEKHWMTERAIAKEQQDTIYNVALPTQPTQYLAACISRLKIIKELKKIAENAYDKRLAFQYILGAQPFTQLDEDKAYAEMKAYFGEGYPEAVDVTDFWKEQEPKKARPKKKKVIHKKVAGKKKVQKIKGKKR